MLTLVLRQVCRCVSLFWGGGVVAGAGGYWGGPGGCSEGYVRERSSAALAGLSWLLMTAMEWTSRTPSPPASRSSSSSTTLTPGSLAPPRPASPPHQAGAATAVSGAPSSLWAPLLASLRYSCVSTVAAGPPLRVSSTTCGFWFWIQHFELATSLA